MDSIDLSFRSLFKICWLPLPLFIASDLSAPKKCRARFGLDQQNNWCGPCRCVSGVPAGVLEQTTAGESSRWYLLPVSLALSTLLPLHTTPSSANQTLICKSRGLGVFFIRPILCFCVSVRVHGEMIPKCAVNAIVHSRGKFKEAELMSRRRGYTPSVYGQGCGLEG